MFCVLSYTMFCYGCLEKKKRFSLIKFNYQLMATVNVQPAYMKVKAVAKICVFYYHPCKCKVKSNENNSQP
jgi:hypothetical protein